MGLVDQLVGTALATCEVIAGPSVGAAGSTNESERPRRGVQRRWLRDDPAGVPPLDRNPFKAVSNFPEPR